MEERITRLERQCRWYRNLFILAGLIAVVLVTWGATKPIPLEIKARQFLAVDANGGTRVRMSSLLGGHLALMNSKGVLIFSVSPVSDGQIKLYNRKGTAIVTIGEHPTGAGFVSINSAEGQTRVGVAGASSSSVPSSGTIAVFNKHTESVAQLAADDYGNGVMVVFNRKGKSRTLQPGP